MIKHNPLNFKVGDTAYLDGSIECTIQSISDKGMFCVVISPLYSTPYEVMTNRLLRENMLKDTPVHVKLKQHLDSITQEEFDKEWNEVVQSMEGVESPTMEEFINNQKDLEPEYSELIKDNFWSLTDEPCTVEDCPHCAYEHQQEYEAELEKDACIEFGDWLTGQGISYVDNTDEGNVYMLESNMNRRMTMKQIYELYLKDQG